MSITFGGINSDDVNLVVERYPSRPIPTRRYYVQQVPGRSGDLLFDEGAYDNIEQSYEIYIRQDAGRSFQEACSAVAAWLMKVHGYQTLTDSYDPFTFRYAYYVGPVDVASVLNQFGRATITFNCKPFRYLLPEDQIEYTTSPNTLTNPTDFVALPRIKIEGSGSAVLMVRATMVTISSIDSGMILDSELMDCYNGANNRNSLITLSTTYEYPSLVPGGNTIAFTGGVSKLTVWPRWRKL